MRMAGASLEKEPGSGWSCMQKSSARARVAEQHENSTHTAGGKLQQQEQGTYGGTDSYNPTDGKKPKKSHIMGRRRRNCSRRRPTAKRTRELPVPGGWLAAGLLARQPGGRLGGTPLTRQPGWQLQARSLIRQVEQATGSLIGLAGSPQAHRRTHSSARLSRSKGLSTLVLGTSSSSSRYCI